jgi:hypothetical protein
MRLAALLAILPGLAFAQDRVPTDKGKFDDKAGVVWYDVRLLGLEGQGWAETKARFDRLPAKAEGTVPDAVWGLSHHSAGLAVRFVTDSAAVQLKWSLTSANLAMPHMPATGVSGLDLYVRSNKDGRWQWAGNGRPAQKDDNRATITVPADRKECLLYLPLYNGVTAVEIGLPKNARLSKAPAREPAYQKPIVFYGTSITQGGCASRPGMVHTAILGRRFERPVINLGFSGSGRMDAAVVELLAELDPAVFVIDCSPNLDAKGITERTGPLVTTLRKAHAATPILLVEDRVFANAPVNDRARKGVEANHTALRAEYEKLVKADVKHLHYLRGDRLIGDDGEGTVDGSHPTDLGFLRQADQFADALAPLLPPPRQNGTESGRKE